MGNSPILSSSEIFTLTTDIDPIVSHLRLRYAEVNVVTRVTMSRCVMNTHTVMVRTYTLPPRHCKHQCFVQVIRLIGDIIDWLINYWEENSIKMHRLFKILTRPGRMMGGFNADASVIVFTYSNERCWVHKTFGMHPYPYPLSYLCSALLLWTLAVKHGIMGRRLPDEGLLRYRQLEDVIVVTNSPSIDLMRSQLTNNQVGIILDVQAWSEKLY